MDGLAAHRPSRRTLMLGALGGLAATAGGSLAFRATAKAGGLETVTRAGMAFQTPFVLTIAGPSRATLDAAMATAITGLRAVENATSVYRVDSDLARLNRTGHLATPHPHLRALVAYTLDLARATDGAFDPTVQPLWDVWAAHAARGERPSDTALAETVQRVDWRRVRLDESISFEQSGMAMTLNSVNQGYAADVVMSILSSHGIEDAFVDTGEFGAHGHHPDGRGWRLGVVAPRDTETLAFTVDPFRRFSATSGDYKTAFSPDFKDHHIFNPKTGRSPPDWSSITVFAPSGLEADGLSTALFTLDAARGAALLRSRSGCSARVFDKSGNERVGWASALTERSHPGWKTAHGTPKLNAT